MTKQKGILLVNMGAPSHELDMKFFLQNMFNDPHILPFKKIGRKALGTIITTFRYKKSWKKYQLIGGTPLIEATCKTSAALSKLFPNYDTRIAFSYTAPLIDEVIRKMYHQGIRELTLVPLYPHYSITTFESAIADAKKAINPFPDLKLTTIAPYFADPAYIQYWTELIQAHVKQHKLNTPILLFSAHSIPTYFVEKQNDPYPQQIKESAKQIAQACNLPYKVSFQSQVKGSKWIGPTTPDTVAELKQQGTEELIYIPISFVSENLETLYDLDHDLVPYAHNQIQIPHVSRIKIPDVHPLFVQALYNKIQETTQTHQ